MATAARALRHKVKLLGCGHRVTAAASASLFSDTLSAPSPAAPSTPEASLPPNTREGSLTAGLRAGRAGSRGFASSGSSSAGGENSSVNPPDMPNIFELFERLEAEYAHLPRLPLVFGEGEEAAEKTARRLKEQQKQEAIQAQRVRKVDQHGVARGLGKRKTATAHVRLWENTAGVSGAQQTVNGKPLPIYFTNLKHRENVLEPFTVSGATGMFNFSVTVHGSGLSAQSQAVRHGLARALQNYNPEFRSALRPEGLLTRDTRVVERKKPGKAKARKSFQWVKR